MASCVVIDGKGVGAAVQREIEEDVRAMRERGERPPGLAVVLVGERKDSQTYVRMKKQAAGVRVCVCAWLCVRSRVRLFAFSENVFVWIYVCVSLTMRENSCVFCQFTTHS